MSEKFEFGDRVQVFERHSGTGKWIDAKYVRFDEHNSEHWALPDALTRPFAFTLCRRPVRTIRIGEREVNAPLWERPGHGNAPAWRANLSPGSEPTKGHADTWNDNAYASGLIFATAADARAAADALLELLREKQ